MKHNRILKHLKRLFGKTQADTITLEEAERAAGFDPRWPLVTKMWLAKRMNEFQQYELVQLLYDSDIQKIRLTEKGKIAMGRMPGDIEAIFSKKDNDQSSDRRGVSIDEIVDIMTKLSEAHPNNTVIYDIKENIITLQ